MDVDQIPLLSMLKDRMAWLNRRQDVLSQNVAGADLPNYKARDLKPMDFAEILKDTTQSSSISLATTDPAHIPSAGSGVSFEETDSPDAGTSSSGNSVSLEAEMIKVSETQAQYQAATNLYAKAIDMMKTAIGRTGS